MERDVVSGSGQGEQHAGFDGRCHNHHNDNNHHHHDNNDRDSNVSRPSVIRSSQPLEPAQHDRYNADIQDATARRDAASKACEDEEGALDAIQANLAKHHTAAEKRLNTHEAELPPFVDPMAPEMPPPADVDRKVRLALAAISLGIASVAAGATHWMHQQVVADARAEWDAALRDGRAREDLRMAYEALNAVPAGTYAAVSAAIIWGAICAFLMAGGQI